MKKLILSFAVCTALWSCGKENKNKAALKTLNLTGVKTNLVKSDSIEKVVKKDTTAQSNLAENNSGNFNSEGIQGYWNATGEHDDFLTANIEGNNLSYFGGPCQSSYTIKMIGDNRFEMVYKGTECRMDFDETFESIDKVIGYGYLKSPDELVFEIKKECFLLDKGQHLLIREKN